MALLSMLTYSIVHGVLNFSVWQMVIATLVMTHITIAAVTIFLHRSQAHRSVRLHPIVNHFFRLWLWLTTGMETKQWVAIHRKHHAFCEAEGDPHSPQLEGINKVLWKGVELYRSEGKNQDTLDHFGKGTPDDWLERHIYAPHSALGVFLMLGLNSVLFGVPGVVVWAVQMMWIPFFAAGVINGIGHYFGYRNFETPDAARNIVPWGILIGGEELHNNHHAFAASPKLSFKRWEFDIGWLYIRILEMLHLAKARQVAELRELAGKTEVDKETLKALVTHRFQLMDRYWKEVVLPVYRQERRKASVRDLSLFRHAKKLLVRQDVVLDEEGRNKLDQLLEKNPSLRLVYEYRLRLQAIWERKTDDLQSGLQRLQEWCQQAEATGLEVLRGYSMGLKRCAVAA